MAHALVLPRLFHVPCWRAYTKQSFNSTRKLDRSNRQRARLCDSLTRIIVSSTTFGISCTGEVSSLYWIGVPGESLPVFTIFSLDVLCSYWTDVAEKNKIYHDAIVLSWCVTVLFFSKCEVLQSEDSFVSLCATVPCAAWFPVWAPIQ